MARYIGPKCKLSRRQGMDLGLKSRARPIESQWGHWAGSGRHQPDTQFLDDQLRELLSMPS